MRQLAAMRLFLLLAALARVNAQGYSAGGSGFCSPGVDLMILIDRSKYAAQPFAHGGHTAGTREGICLLSR